VRLFVVCLVASGVAVTAGRAEAFCRTTTSPVPIDYNPVVSGCLKQGVPLYWPIDRVPYGVSAAGSSAQKISGADATRVADLAFSAWNEATCEGGAPSIKAYDDGPLESIPDASDCSNSLSCDPVVHDFIVFDDPWPYQAPGDLSDPTAANTIALTTVSYGLDDGRIFEAKTEVNATLALTTEEPPPAGSDAFDLRVILTHEAGHFFGLAHATETTSIMYAYYQSGATELTPDDVSGICTIYPPSGPSSGACSATPLRAHTGPSRALAAVVALCICGAARRRSRRSREGRREDGKGEIVLMQ
jgi:hypothetical protein